MRTIIASLLCVFSLFLPAWSQNNAFDRALAQAGLSRESARLDPIDLQLYGSGEYRLPFFDSVHLDPWRVPLTVQMMRIDALENADSVANLLAAAGLRLSEGTRRTLLGDPTETLKRRAGGFKQPLRQAVEAIYRAANQPFPRNARWVQKIASVPIELQKPVAYLLLAMVEARRWRDFAFHEVIKSRDAQTVYKMLCQSPVASDDMQEIFNTTYWRLMREADLKALFAGAQDLMLVTEHVAQQLVKTPIRGGFRIDLPTPWGLIALHDGRSDTYATNRYLLIVDAAGSDTYVGQGGNASPEHAISVTIDLQGDDRYLQDSSLTSQAVRDLSNRKDKTVAPSIGGAVLGYAFVVDMEGKDLYRSLSITQGAAAFGVGVLVDASGDDRYECYTNGQGSADWGIGLLVDRAGNDRYHCFSTAQGYGGTKGYGLLLDVSGDDTYLAEDKVIDFPSPQTQQHNVSMAQGAGCGRRADFSDGHSLAGGIGILVDGAGDDRYACGVFGQGVGYWYGLGVLSDGAGNDDYEGVWYVQGASAHFAVGVLEDVSGNDRYTATMNMAQGAGHDFSLGWLLELGGSDSYRAPNLSLGAGNANGIGILWDASGDDCYEVAPSITLGRSSIGAKRSLRERALCLGLFCDTGGNDTYPDRLSFARNGSVWNQPGASQPPMKREVGVGIDCEEVLKPEDL